jgi:DNA modification methylase
VIKDQIHTESYSIYNGDNMDVLPMLPENSIGLSLYSPPFCGLYQYSSDHRDMSNCETREQFLQQYDFMVKEVARITKPGRITAVHCTDVFDNSCNLWDFPNEIIKIHARHGFQYRCRQIVRKEPLKVRMRTMVKSLMHKLVVEDMTQCFSAMPDYVLIFTKKGDNAEPVVHPFGLTEFPYFGDQPILPHFLVAWNNDDNNPHMDSCEQLWDHLNTKYKGHKDAKTNKLSHYTWRRYADAFWDDIRIDNVLPFRDSKEEDDEKHVHPLQLDVIDRLSYMYSNTGDTVLTPFMGVGSEVYSPVSMGRKAIGIELKDSYFKQSRLNLEVAETRFEKVETPEQSVLI